MKKNKIIVCLVAMMLTMSLAACGANGDRTSDETTTQSGNVEGMVHLESAEEVAALFEAAYQNIPSDQLPMMLETRELDLQDSAAILYNAGIGDVSEVESVTLSESMVGSIAYSAVYIRTKEGADVEALAEEMMENIDPAKWICVLAEKQIVASFGDDIFYIMADKEMAQKVYDNAANAAKEKDMSVVIISEKTNN